MSATSLEAQTTATLPAGSLPSGFAAAQVVGRSELAPGIETFRLRLASAPSEPVAPGSHLELLLPIESADVPEVRHYSITEHAGAEISIAVLREEDGRGGSRWMHENARSGAELAVRGPRNTFPFEASESVLFIAGGIGITPFLTMIEEAEQAGSDWRLLYLGRSRSGMAFADRLLEHGDRVIVWPSEDHGRSDLKTLFGELPWKTRVYACGPESLQSELRLHSAETGHVLVIEDFDAGHESGETSDSAATDDDRPMLPFVVELADGTEVDVPADKTILEALNDEGFRVLSSCRRGTCGTCETPIIEGEADHRDSVLSDEEKAANECMMICVSRACGDRIVIDL